MQNKCGNCKFWLEKEDWKAGNYGFKKCHGILHRIELEDLIPQKIKTDRWKPGDTIEAEQKYEQADKEIFNKHPAYTQDASDCIADLFTKEEFFCALHKPVDNP